jgi:hypothetical protein
MPWIAFIDESGDHGLKNIDPASPMFAITACVFRVEEYFDHEIPSITRLKHRFWSHEGIILRNYDITKKQGPFSICQDTEVRSQLYQAICDLFLNSPCKIISAIIDKQRHQRQYIDPINAYALAVQFVLERIYLMVGNRFTVIFEARGRKEDRELEKWCSDISQANATGHKFECDIHFAAKVNNVAGLQMADLACNPIIHYVLHPDTQRPDWLAVKSCVRSRGGRMSGYGLKTFP